MIKNIYKRIITALILFLAFAPIGMAQIFQGSEDSTKTDTQAGAENIESTLKGSGITGTEDVGDLILKYVNFALPYLAIAAFVGFVYAGFLYVTAYGSDEQLQKSKKILIYVAIGLILVLLSYSIIQVFTSDLIKGISSNSSN